MRIPNTILMLILRTCSGSSWKAWWGVNDSDNSYVRTWCYIYGQQSDTTAVFRSTFKPLIVNLSDNKTIFRRKVVCFNCTHGFCYVRTWAFKKKRKTWPSFKL